MGEEGTTTPGCCPSGVTTGVAPGMTCSPTGTKSDNGGDNKCYPLDGGQTQCFDPTHPVEVTCTGGVSDMESTPGCCPENGVLEGHIPGMTCTVTDDDDGSAAAPPEPTSTETTNGDDTTTTSATDDPQDESAPAAEDDSSSVMTASTVAVSVTSAMIGI